MRLVSQASVRRRLEAGDRVDDHLIIRSVLGHGGTAVVFEALHTRLNSLVALKVVNVEAAYARDAAARLEREALVCAAIDDPHIPKIYDVGQLDDGTPYIVMEKLSGPTLEDMLEEGPIRPRVALSIVRDLLSALSAVHRVSVVHRDVKPSNLIVQTADDGAYRVRLMDFGVSKAMSNYRSDPAITHEGALVGTPHYMAPEQMSDEGVDGRTDVYAAGVLLYELLAGCLPFDGGSTAEVMSAVLRHTHVPLGTRCPQLPKALSALVERAMAARPEERFASARNMRDALDAAIAVMDVPRKSRRPLPSSLHARHAIAYSLLSVTVAFLLALGSRHATRTSAAEQTVTQQTKPQQRVNPEQTHQATPASMTEAMAATVRPAKVARAPSRVRANPPPAPRVAKGPLRTSVPSSAAVPSSSAKAATETADALSEPANATHDSDVESATRSEVAIAQGVLVSDYVRQLDELGRVVSEVAESLAEPGPLPANPYQ